MAAPLIKHNVTVDFAGGAISLTGDLVHHEDHRALELVTEEGPERLSTDLSAYGLLPAEGNVFVKDWSEHAGVADSLVLAGLARRTREVEVGPFGSTAYELEVLL